MMRNRLVVAGILLLCVSAVSRTVAVLWLMMISPPMPLLQPTI